MLSEEKLSKIIGDIADNYEQEDLCSYTHYHGAAPDHVSGLF